MENIAEIIRQAQNPTRVMADLSSKAQRHRKALQVAEEWVEAALGDTEMCGRAQIARDQLVEELSRTAFEIDVVEQKRLIAAGREWRSEREAAAPLEVVEASPEELYRESRDSTLSDVQLDAYTTLSVAPLDVFGVGARVAEERTRYVMVGALMVAVDAAIGKQEPE
jgi:hypothetical protein